MGGLSGIRHFYREAGWLGLEATHYHSGYDAEATISEDGKKIVFTSMRNGDLDIYSMDTNGKHVKQLTHELGYDGGPFFSKDRKWIVYRAYHPKTDRRLPSTKSC